MFYKIIDKYENIIDIAANPIFYKYSQNSNTYLPATKHVATAVEINGNMYQVHGDGPDTYLVLNISEQEYLNLKAAKIGSKPAVSSALARVRADKICEFRATCQDAIIAGCDVKLLSGTEHFSLTIEDQLNINRLMLNCSNSNTENIVYHGCGQKARKISVAEFKKIYAAMNKHILYHTTYFNCMKTYINNNYSIDELRNLKYGDPLIDPADRKLLLEIRRQ